MVGIIVQFFPKIPHLGKFRGDIYLKRENFSFYFPLITSITLSLLITIALTSLSSIK